MIIAVDVDDVCCNLVEEWVNRYNDDYQDSLDYRSIDEWDISKFVVSRCGKKIYDYLDHPDLYDFVKPVDDALNGVNLLREHGHRVIFVTSAVNGCAGRKLRWLQDWEFLDAHRKFDPDYVECHDKGLIRADVLVDDGAHNLRVFKGHRIQFLQPWNENEHVEGAWLACYWGEVPAIIEDIVDEMKEVR